MNYRAALGDAAVAASAPVTYATAGLQQTLISLGVGLIGVWLARTVFVNRENRRLGRDQHWRETLPVTLAACLIAGAIIWDQHLGISAAAFLGLGCGWTTVLLLEFFGDNILNAMRALSGRDALPASRQEAPVEPPQSSGMWHDKLPDDFKQLLADIDHAASQHPPPSQD